MKLYSHKHQGNKNQ